MADPTITVNTPGPQIGDVLSTAEQLDACPDNTIVLDHQVVAWQKLVFNGWHRAQGMAPETRPSMGLAMSATGHEVIVVYVPGQPLPTPSLVDGLRQARDQAATKAKKAEGWARRRARDLTRARAALAGIRTVVDTWNSSFDLDGHEAMRRVSTELMKLEQAPERAAGGIIGFDGTRSSGPDDGEHFIRATRAGGWLKVDDSAPSSARPHPDAAAQSVADLRSRFVDGRDGIRSGALAELGNYMRWIVELLPNDNDHVRISVRTFRDLAAEADELLFVRELRTTEARTANRAADALQQQAESASTQRDTAYTERARLVAYLAALYPSRITAADSPEWPVVTVLTPAGQMTWHIARADAHLFAHVPTDADPTHTRQGDLWIWDGHSTTTKHERLALLVQLTDRLRKETTFQPRIWAAGVGHADQAATPGYTTHPEALADSAPSEEG